jgi:hypothetical protein
MIINLLKPAIVKIEGSLVAAYLFYIL